jgi:hypothetical protein
MLETKQVGKYVIKRAGFFESMKLADARVEADKIAVELGEIDATMNYALFVWPTVAACVEPRISWDEFPHIHDDEIMAVIAAVMELNAHWFAEPDPKN